MKEKELTSAEKARITKLNKKTNEELISIIIRKDDVERRKDKLVKYLKVNINGLENKIKSIKENLNNISDEYSNLSINNSILIQDYKDAKETISSLNEDKDILIKNNETLKKNIDRAIGAAIKCFIIGLIIGGIIGFVL